MPDNPSPFDDPLADLYGQLPGSRREQTSDANAAVVPSSRRAAREARGATPSASAPASADQPITRPRAPQPEAAHARPTPTQTQTHTRPMATQTRERPAATQARPAGGGSLDDLFTGRRGIDEVGSVPPSAEKRRRRIGGWIAFGIVLALLAGLVLGGMWAVNTFGSQLQGIFAPAEREDFEAGIANGETTILIESGDTGSDVSRKLFDAGVTKAPSSLYDYLIETSTAFPFQPGVFRLQLQMTSEAVIVALRNPENRIENRAQLPEGLTVEATIAEVSEQMQIPLPDLEAAVADPAAYGVAAESLEGWLFPATYDFNPGTPATDIIRTMVNRTIQSLDENGVPEADRQRILITASIIQREARAEQDFYKVSRVIQNRLDPGNQETFGKLQMDSTAQYGYGELHDGTASTSDEAQFDDNPWNTYVRAGLPVGPIANSGDLAIDAALHPADGPWLYFVTVNLDTGESIFTSTYAEHQQAIVQMQEWCSENPDAGC